MVLQKRDVLIMYSVLKCHITIVKKTCMDVFNISSRLKKRKSEENEQNWEGKKRREKVGR
jgi:hypothetical protein